MQELSNAIADRFKELGGELLLSRRAKKIDIKDGKASGVTIEHEGFIPARFVVSNCDARQTFLTLLGSNELEEEFCMKLKDMQPSTSSFIIYLGMDKTFKSPLLPGTVYLRFYHHDVETAFQTVNSNELGDGSWYAVRTSLDATAVYIEMLTPFQNEDYWKRNKEKILDKFIDKLERETIPNLSHHILFKDAATPHTLARYTLNYRGASYGWAGIPSQTIVPGFRKPSFVQNLYLAGHWTTLAIGISGVAYVGYDTATLIMKRQKGFSIPVSM
jgi:phytoene dehydrogenase-like protein